MMMVMMIIIMMMMMMVMMMIVMMMMMMMMMMMIVMMMMMHHLHLISLSEGDHTIEIMPIVFVITSILSKYHWHSILSSLVHYTIINDTLNYHHHFHYHS